MKKIITKCIVIATTLLIMVPSFIGIAYANETKVPNTTVEYIDVAEVEKDLKFLFTEATSYENGVLYVNKELLTERYGTLAPYIAMGIERIYTEPNLVQNLQASLQDRDFVSCMRDELIGMIPGMELVDLMRGDIISYIQGQMWGKAASYIAMKLAKFIAMKLAKFGMKSNVAGIVAQLGISAGKCAIWG